MRILIAMRRKSFLTNATAQLQNYQFSRAVISHEAAPTCNMMFTSIFEIMLKLINGNKKKFLKLFQLRFVFHRKAFIVSYSKSFSLPQSSVFLFSTALLFQWVCGKLTSSKPPTASSLKNFTSLMKTIQSFLRLVLRWTWSFLLLTLTKDSNRKSFFFVVKWNSGELEPKALIYCQIPP